MVTSASPLQSALQEAREALDEISRHDQLLSTSWRRRLGAVRSTLAQLAEGEGDPRALRSVRAQVSTAASESALAGQFESRLVKLPAEQLRAISAQLEVCFASTLGHRAEAAAHLDKITGALLAELRAGLAADPANASTRVLRYEERFADDVSAALRGYADRIEQLLLDLGESVHAAVGAPAGGLLPTRQAHAPPRPDLQHITVSDASRIGDELATVVGRSVELFRDSLTGRVEEAIDTLRGRIGRAERCHALGERALRERADELAGIARRMHQLAEALDWMLLDAR